VVAAGAAILLAGCGTGGLQRDANAGAGKQLFVENCGGCHTLADAGTSGKVGPDLDASFGPSRAQGFKETTIRQVVRDQIHLPSPGNGEPGFPVMPADIVTGEDADSVSAYVATMAGAGAAPTSATAGTPPAAPPPAASGSTTGQTTTAGGGGTTTGGTTTGGAKPGGLNTGGGDPGNGSTLFASLGCGGCHSADGQNGTGPTLKDVFGAKVQLTTGKTVAADVAYLMQSIEDPDAEIVKGYQPGVMSAVIKPHQVAESDARDLVAYIATLK